MSKTIAINAGSSSLKWQLYQMPEEEVLAQGIIERIGLKDSISTVKYDGKKEEQILDIHDHAEAVKILLNDLIHFGIIAAYDEITGVGHRIVAGGEYFKESVVVDDTVVEQVEELSALAPLHNPERRQGFVPSVIFCQILPVFVCLTHHSTPAWQNILTFTQFLKNIIRIIKFVNMELMGQVINMWQKKLQKCLVVH